MAGVAEKFVYQGVHISPQSPRSSPEDLTASPARRWPLLNASGALAWPSLTISRATWQVHMQFKGEFTEPWKPNEARNNRLIFIGKNLDRARIVEGFNACRDCHEYILEEAIPTTKLRFAVGDSVAVKTAPSEFSPGEVAATFHREPQFPPGHVVPYQVRLASGSAVYVPADTDDFVRAQTTSHSGGRVPSFIESSFTSRVEYDAWVRSGAATP